MMLNVGDGPPIRSPWAAPSTSIPLPTLPIAETSDVFIPIDIARHGDARRVAADFDAVVSVLGDHVRADENVLPARADQHAVVSVAEVRIGAEGGQAAKRVVRGEVTGRVGHHDAVLPVARVDVAERNGPPMSVFVDEP
jgi:hypothetical protein